MQKKNKKQKDLETEELIKSTAKNLYFKEGKFGATTQEIADAAGINRTLINYYFRSRDNLFNQIFEEAVSKEVRLREEIISMEISFREKMEKYLDVSYKLSHEYPYLESYIVTRLNDGIFYKEKEDWERFIRIFLKDFEEEKAKGRVHDIEPIHFLLNLRALISYPYAIRPLIQRSLRMSDKAYDEILKERKDVIMKIIFK